MKPYIVTVCTKSETIVSRVLAESSIDAINDAIEVYGHKAKISARLVREGE
jgi:hypothetical protein